MRRVEGWCGVVAAMVVEVDEVEILCLIVLWVEEDCIVLMSVDEDFGRVF